MTIYIYIYTYVYIYICIYMYAQVLDERMGSEVVRVPHDNMHVFTHVYLYIFIGTRGWSLKGQERKEKNIWTARQVNHDLTSRCCCYRCSTLFNYNRPSCTGAFFDLIEWHKDYFLDLYFIFNFFNVNYFSFLDMLGLVIHHFWWKESFFRTPGSCRYTNSIELVPRFGLWPSSHRSWKNK